MLAFHRSSIYEKLNHLEGDLSDLLSTTSAEISVPEIPARDALILPTKDHPKKLGLSLIEGQARALHDLASIELQAMELGLRTLAEFPDANRDFRNQMADLTLNEGEHLKLCLKSLIEKFKVFLPRRVENIDVELRKKAGFDQVEIKLLEELRTYFIKRQLSAARFRS